MYIGTFATRVSTCLSSFPTPQEVMEFEITPEEDARIQYLGAKHNNGELTRDERDEYGAAVLASNMISMAKLRARLKINGTGVAA